VAILKCQTALAPTKVNRKPTAANSAKALKGIRRRSEAPFSLAKGVHLGVLLLAAQQPLRLQFR
jgi:hypothetical protein